MQTLYPKIDIQTKELKQLAEPPAKPYFALGLALILTLAALSYICLAINWPKFSRAEVFFAECAREMLKEGNSVTPLYHGKPFFDKPILVYWMILASFKIFGVSHLAARITSICAALATVATVGIVTRAVSTARSGLLAAMALSSSFMYFSFASLCMSDMLLTFFDAVSLSCLYLGTIHRSKQTSFWIAAAASMGLAFLTKGPVAVVLPTASMLTYLALTRQLILIKPKHIFFALITICFIASPWFIAAYNVNGAGALRYFFLHENLERFLGSTYDTHRAPWFMLISLLTGFAPWAVFLPNVLLGSINKWRHEYCHAEARIELFLWLWIATIICFFSISRGKIDYYALPAYPAAASLVGIYLGNWTKTNSRPVTVIGWSLAVCLFGLALAGVLFLPRLNLIGGLVPWFTMPTILFIAALTMMHHMRYRKWFQSYAVVFLAICSVIMVFCLQILPTMVDLQPVLKYIDFIKKSPHKTRIAIDKSVECWIDEVTFQTNREPVKIADKKDLDRLLSTADPVLMIMPKDRFAALAKDVQTHWQTIASHPYTAHSINPGYFIKRQGALAEKMPLLLVARAGKSTANKLNSHN